MSITKNWKIYGVEGHRQRESFNESYYFDCSNKFGRVGARIVKVYNSDFTDTNEFTIVSIVADNEEDCYSEMNGQLLDGIFENSRVGLIEEISDDEMERLIVNKGELPSMRELEKLPLNKEISGKNETTGFVAEIKKYKKFLRNYERYVVFTEDNRQYIRKLYDGNGNYYIKFKNKKIEITEEQLYW